ncbi:TPA: hypothetical protein ACGO3A_000263 [Streptococcus suis]
MELESFMPIPENTKLFLETGILSENEDTIVYIISESCNISINFGYVDYCQVSQKSLYNIEKYLMGLYEVQDSIQVQKAKKIFNSDVYHYLLFNNQFALEILTDSLPDINRFSSDCFKGQFCLPSDIIIFDDWDKLWIPQDNYLSSLKMDNYGKCILSILGNNKSYSIEIKNFMRLRFYEEGRDIYETPFALDDQVNISNSLYPYRIKDKKLYGVQGMLNYNFWVEYT